MYLFLHTNGLVKERRNSSALAVEFRLSCINPLMPCRLAVYTAVEVRHR